MILLVDMDAFFASVEQAQHPPLRGKPVIVCGDPSRRGVVTAASYEARAFGVHAAMRLQEARQLCPCAEYVEGNPEKYVAMSLQLLDLYTRYSPDVEPFSVDEAFVALRGASVTMESAITTARAIQAEIDERYQIGASVGVGPNKLVAKMAAGVHKPRGLTALDEEGSRHVLAARGRIDGALAEARHAHAVARNLDRRRACPRPSFALSAAFGIIGPQLKEAAWGRDEPRSCRTTRASSPSRWATR